MVIGKGLEKGHLLEEEVLEFSSKVLQDIEFSRKKILVIIPDHTRTAPLPLFFKVIYDLIGNKVKKLDYLIALGTHPPLSEDRILKLIGITKEEKEKKYSTINFFNHKWNDPSSLVRIGTISKEKIEEITEGLIREGVDVEINKMVLDYDILVIVGPTFPHEVVGFSGGNKYFFPGISGPRILNFFHWLGALITNMKINGIKDTPVRKVIDLASSFIKIPKVCFSLVVKDGKLSGLFIGTPEEAWDKAVELSKKLHIIYKDKPFKEVLGVAPKMYEDLWTAGKVMYKLENVVEDGGELIIYAPHITEVSYTHGKILDKVGYHVRDYFLAQEEKFSWVPGGIKAHSTHVKGIGTYKDGIEKPRINVILATGIPKERCELINLGYRDPKEIDLSSWENKENEGKLLVWNAGEILYRLK
ncbi:MAG: lactate racemase domain-containing protein [candidate division WOR-3 bacterium]